MKSEDVAIDGLIKFQVDRGLDKKEFNIKDEVVNILSEIYEMFGYKGKVGEELADDLFDKEFKGLIVTNEENLVDAFADIITFSTGGIMKLGYCPKISLKECGKEINSRTGEYRGGKFHKHTDALSLSKRYIANYKRAKINPEKDNQGYIPDYFKESGVN